MADDYRIRSQKGDFVRLPDGRTGIIVKTDLLVGGNAKEVTVKLDTSWRKKRFCESDINQLELICTAEELKAIGNREI